MHGRKRDAAYYVEDFAQPGSGDYEDEDEYYYLVDGRDQSAERNDEKDCVSMRLEVPKEDPSVLVANMPDLAECALYSVDIAASDGRGRVLQPGEQYGTIHSTLCEAPKEGEAPFWFDDDDATNADGEEGGNVLLSRP